MSTAPARLATGLWAVWVALRWGGHAAGWADAWGAWRQVSLADVAPGGWPAGVARHLATLGLAAVLVLAQAGAGWQVAAWVRSRRLARWERGAIAVLVGFALVGGAGFGLACAGLFRAPLLVVTSFAGLAGARRAVGAIRSARPGRPPGWWPWAVVPAGIAAVRALAPDTHVDTYTYHLATTEAWLKAGALSLAGAGLPHHFPMTAECVAAIPVAWGVETAVPFVHLAVFGAGLVLVAARTGGWTAVALGATGGLVLMHLPLAKNDLAAAGCLLGGVAIGAGNGPAVLAGLLLGCGSAIKLNGPPMILAMAMWSLVRRTGGWRRAGVLVAAVVPPLLPWLVKSWLMTGDPVYPVLAPRLSSVPWDAESTRAVAWMTAAEPARVWVPRLPMDLLRALTDYLPGGLLLLPVVVVTGLDPRRRGLLVIALVDLVICRALMPSEWYRLALPGFVLIAAVASAAVAKSGAAAVIAVVLAGWLPLGRQVLAGVNAPVLAGYLAGVVPRPEYAARMFTTLDRARRDLAAQPGVRGVLLSGEIRSYRLPGRPLQERCWGRTHAWALAGESRSPQDVARKIRQLGATHLLYNVVTEQFPHGYAGEFPWDDRRLAVWKGYVAGWTRIAVPMSRMDLVNGGFVIFELRRDPVPSRGPLPFLPGIAGMIFRVTAQPDPAVERAEARALAARLPDVLHARNLAGLAAMRAGDQADAYARFAPGAAAGIADVHNFLGYALAAAKLGRRAEAERFLARAVEVEPGLAGRIDLSGTVAR